MLQGGADTYYFSKKDALTLKYHLKQKLSAIRTDREDSEVVKESEFIVEYNCSYSILGTEVMFYYNDLG